MSNIKQIFAEKQARLASSYRSKAGMMDSVETVKDDYKTALSAEITRLKEICHAMDNESHGGAMVATLKTRITPVSPDKQGRQWVTFDRLNDANPYSLHQLEDKLMSKARCQSLKLRVDPIYIKIHNEKEIEKAYQEMDEAKESFIDQLKEVFKAIHAVRDQSLTRLQKCTDKGR